MGVLGTNASRRGSILIEPYKQLRFGLTFLLVNFLFATVFLGVFGYYLWEVYQAMSVYFRLDEAQAFVTFEKIRQPALLGLGITVLFIATTLFLSARYTHQIYGPKVSFLRFIDELLADQRPAPIKLRASDQLQDLAAKLNELAAKWPPPAQPAPPTDR